MADEYIRKQDAVDAFNRAVQDVEILDADDIKTVFGMLSSADVVQVRHGRWTHKPNIYGVAYCSECDYELRINNASYCPNCGAKMDARGEE